MEKQKYIGYEKGRFYLTEPPVFGTITSKHKDQIYFYPMKTFHQDYFQENMIHLDINQKWKEAFYMNMNSYDDKMMKDI